MAGELDDIDNLGGSGHQSKLTGALHVGRQVMDFCLVASRIVQANHRGVKVQVGVNSHGITQVLRQAERLRQEHENAGQDVVKLPVSLPKASVVDVFRVIISLGAVNMPQNSIEEVTENHCGCKIRVGGAVENFC